VCLVSFVVVCLFAAFCGQNIIGKPFVGPHIVLGAVPAWAGHILEEKLASILVWTQCLFGQAINWSMSLYMIVIAPPAQIVTR